MHVIVCHLKLTTCFYLWWLYQHVTAGSQLIVMYDSAMKYFSCHVVHWTLRYNHGNDLFISLTELKEHHFTLKVSIDQKLKMLNPCVKQWITYLQMHLQRILVDTVLLVVRNKLYLKEELMTKCHTATLKSFLLFFFLAVLHELVTCFKAQKQCEMRDYSWPSINI